MIDKINKYLSEVLLFGDYKDRTEVIDNLILNIKALLAYFVIIIIKNNHILVI